MRACARRHYHRPREKQHFVNAIYQNQNDSPLAGHHGNAKRYPGPRTGRVGNWGEAVAARYLAAHGYQVIAQNVEYRDGEVDLVVTKGGVLFFVEVKTRADERMGTVEAVTPGKQRRLLRAAMRFVQAQGLTGAPSQFDCVVVLGRPGDHTARVRHYRNIGG